MTRTAVAAALALAASAVHAQQPAGGTGAAPSGEPAQASSSEKAGSSASQAPAKGTKPEAAGPGASTAAQELARTLVSEKSWSAMLDGYASALSSQIQRALQASGQPAPAGLEEKVRTQLGKSLAHADGVSLEAEQLGARFTTQELRTIEQFYKSPTGQKLIRELPEMSTAVDDQIRRRLTEAVPRIVQNVAPSLAQAGAGGGKGTETQTSPSEKSPPPAAQGRTPPGGSKRP